MIHHKGHHGHDDGGSVEKAPSWLLSFGDVSALLLAFFVMLFSMSTLKTEDYEMVISKINQTEQQEQERFVSPVADQTIETVAVVPAQAPEYLERILKEKMSQDPVLSEALITLKDDRIILSLPSDEIFLDGTAIISKAAEKPLFALAGVMVQFSNKVMVEGHTDPRAANTKLYPSNWELSLARALAVAHYLNQSGYQQPLSLLGHGDGKYKFLDKELIGEKRKVLARRVDLVIYPEAGS